MRTSFLSWGASAALHVSLAALAATWVVHHALVEEPPGRAVSGRTAGRALGDDDAGTVTFRVVVPSPHARTTPELQGIDEWKGGVDKCKGESLDFVSDKPFRGKGTYDIAGPGAGGGGRYGARPGPYDNGSGSPSPPGGPAARDSVLAALSWLARHQRSDGTWSGDDPCGLADSGPADLEATAQATLAFLEAGIAPRSEVAWGDLRPGRAVLHGLQALQLRQGPGGEIDGVAALALVHGHLTTRTREFAEASRSAAAALLQAPVPADRRAAFWHALAVRWASESDLDFRRGPRPEVPRLAGSDPLAEFSAALARPVPEARREEIRRLQNRTGCKEGSWDPVEGAPSRVAATALYTITLLRR